MIKMIFNEAEMIEKYGFYSHYVFETYENELNGLANIHTHGLKESFNHMDLQIVLPLEPQTVNGLLHTIVNNIKEGKVYKSGKLYDDVIENYCVMFKKFKEHDRDVLRLLLPDKDGFFPKDKECADMYKRQIETLPGDE